MREINLNNTGNDMFHKFHLDKDEVIKVTYEKGIDDLLLTADGGDILMSWDMHEWDDEKCVLIRERDNFKEISGLTCKIILFKSYSGAPVTIFTCAQIN